MTYDGGNLSLSKQYLQHHMLVMHVNNNKKFDLLVNDVTLHVKYIRKFQNLGFNIHL